MNNKTHLILIFAILFFVGGLLSFVKPEIAAAQNMKALLVQITNIPLAITGQVDVRNLPIDAGSNSLRTMSSGDKLTDGFDIIALQEGWPRQLDIPVGVALTDVVIERINGIDDKCTVWLYHWDFPANSMGYLVELQPSSIEPISELHFESGLRSTEERRIGFFVNAMCRVNILWTGYEY